MNKKDKNLTKVIVIIFILMTIVYWYLNKNATVEVRDLQDVIYNNTTIGLENFSFDTVLYLSDIKKLNDDQIVVELMNLGGIFFYR